MRRLVTTGRRSASTIWSTMGAAMRNQANRKGAAQDKTAHANQVQNGDSKDSKNTQRPQQVPREKGGADWRDWWRGFGVWNDTP